MFSSGGRPRIALDRSRHGLDMVNRGSSHRHKDEDTKYTECLAIYYDLSNIDPANYCFKYLFNKL